MRKLVKANQMFRGERQAGSSVLAAAHATWLFRRINRRAGILVAFGIIDKHGKPTYVWTVVLIKPILEISMDVAIPMIVLACACLVVGIYFFFVRTKKTDQTPTHE
jgi:hypothetical protein